MALHRAFDHLVNEDLIPSIPLVDQVAGISCGLIAGEAVADLDYSEDSTAEADANFVITAGGGLVEIQATGEQGPFTRRQFEQMLEIAETACDQLFAVQRTALGLSEDTFKIR